MIFTKRPEPTPQDVIDALRKPLAETGTTELEAARAYYAQPQAPEKAYPFSRYKEYEVCHQLDVIFSRKCAYCESKYEAVSARDVEHYRPKGAVAKAPNHPGYWWLAAEWTNLLPSCPACNQRRRHVEYRSGMSLEDIERAELTKPRQTFGKGNAFPVRGDNWVTTENSDLELEDPLLLNPCVRDPKLHLDWEFGYDPQFSIWEAVPILPRVRPRQNAQGEDDPYAASSIAIYGLNRAGVFRSRMEHIKLVQKPCKRFANAFRDLRKLTDLTTPVAQLQQNSMQEAHLEMAEFMQPQQVYAGMTRAFIEQMRAALAA